jgi:hypothetical protein
MFKVTMQSEILQNTMTDPGDFQFFPALWVQSSRSRATSQWTSLPSKYWPFNSNACKESHWWFELLETGPPHNRTWLKTAKMLKRIKWKNMAHNMEEALRMSPSQHLLLYPFLQNQILDSHCHLEQCRHHSQVLQPWKTHTWKHIQWGKCYYFSRRHRS